MKMKVRVRIFTWSCSLLSFKCLVSGNILSSSIHAIFARAKLGKRPARQATSSALETVHDTEESSRTEDPSVLDEESEEDFEPHTPSQDKVSKPRPFTVSPQATLDLNIPGLEARGSEITHSTNGGTVKLQRRAKLAEKLRTVYDLKDIHEVVAG